MSQIVVGMDQIFGPFCCRKFGSTWHPGMGATIGLMDKHAGIVAATMYTDWNKANVVAHIAAAHPERNWMTREFLWYIFHYPFEQLKARRLTAPVYSDNVRCLRLVEAMGFKFEACLDNAAPNGDILLFRMLADECRWLKLKDKRHGKV